MTDRIFVGTPVWLSSVPTNPKRMADHVSFIPVVCLGVPEDADGFSPPVKQSAGRSVLTLKGRLR